MFLYRILMIFVSVYNIIFIPLQFGFRIDFKGIYLIMEIFTILLYGIDVGVRIFEYRKIKK